MTNYDHYIERLYPGGGSRAVRAAMEADGIAELPATTTVGQRARHIGIRRIEQDRAPRVKECLCPGCTTTISSVDMGLRAWCRQLYCCKACFHKSRIGRVGGNTANDCSDAPGALARLYAERVIDECDECGDEATAHDIASGRKLCAECYRQFCRDVVVMR